MAILRHVYNLNKEGKASDIENTKAKLVKLLKEAQQFHGSVADSPLFQLVEGFPNIDYAKKHVFQEKIQQSSEIKEEIAASRRQGKEALVNLEKQINDEVGIKNLESGVIGDLFLAYRAVRAWPEMINLVKEKMSTAISNTVMVQEQLAFALSRNGQGEEAEQVIINILAKDGPSSGTYGILGRLYRDRWQQAYDKGQELLVLGLLEQSIEAYLKGFDYDLRDASTGLNAIILMEIKEPPDPRRIKLIPVVDFAVERRVTIKKPDYWDYSNLLQLAVLAKDKEKAIASLLKAIELLRESWEAAETASNIHLIRIGQEKKKESIPWIKEIEETLNNAAQVGVLVGIGSALTALTQVFSKISFLISKDDDIFNKTDVNTYSLLTNQSHDDVKSPLIEVKTGDQVVDIITPNIFSKLQNQDHKYVKALEESMLKSFELWSMIYPQRQQSSDPTKNAITEKQIKEIVKNMCTDFTKIIEFMKEPPIEKDITYHYRGIKMICSEL